MARPTHISIYDSTLRDGSQGGGVSFSLSDKIRIARALDNFGIDYVEGGWPGSNPKDAEFFTQMRRKPLQHARLVAFGATCRAGSRPEDDANLQALLEAGTDVVAIVGKSWCLHVQEVLKVSLKANLRMVADTVAYLAGQGREVIFDAEHFFDGYQADREYALEVLQTARRAGAATLVLCDTNGGTLPDDLAHICAEVREAVPSIPLGIHCHNDSGCAVAGSLLAVRAGCTQVQGCLNGYGERCGNADLCAIIPALSLKMGCECLADSANLPRLTWLSRMLSELTVQREMPNQPYVGRMAFAHKGGMHVDAVTKNPRTFEHVDPEIVGNQRHFLLSEHAGLSSVLEKATEQSLDIPGAEARGVLELLKQKEAEGYSYEAAEASFRLLVDKFLGRSRPHFSLEGFRVIVEKRSLTEDCLSEATIKVNVNGRTELTAAEGRGPVDALDLALRKALGKFYPQLERMQLRDFKVRILDGSKGTAAQTRVLIESSDGGLRNWGTVGLSENIIEASWQALLDSVEFLLGQGLDNGQEDKHDDEEQ